MHLPSFPVQGVMPGFTFPLSTVGRLGHITSPPTRPQFSHHGHRYYVPLRPPQSISGRFAFAPFPIPCCFPLFVSCRFRQLVVEQARLYRRLGSWYTGSPYHPVVFFKETCRLSQVRELPLYAHAPVSDPGGVPHAHHVACRTDAFQLVNFCRLSPSSDGLSLRTTTILVSGFIFAACTLASPLLRTPPLRDRTSVPLLACWLAFGVAGFAPAGQHQQISAPIGTSQRFTFHLARLRFSLGQTVGGRGYQAERMTCMTPAA